MQEALGFGALGYVAKTNAGIELLAAVEAVSQGGQFVGAGLAGRIPAEGKFNRFHHEEVLRSPPEAGD